MEKYFSRDKQKKELASHAIRSSACRETGFFLIGHVFFFHFFTVEISLHTKRNPSGGAPPHQMGKLRGSQNEAERD
jgi:hypothetical protein